MNPVDIARLFLHVREAGANRGQRVEAIQKWCGGSPGESWCCYFATMVLDLHYQGKAPVPRIGSCDVVLALAKDQGWLTTAPQMGDLYLRLNDPTDAHHIGFVVTPPVAGVFRQISGNTSEDGKSSNGDGVYERDVPLPPPDKIAFVRLPARA